MVFAREKHNIFAATETGGIWKTNDYGVTWVKINSTNYLGDVMIDPQNSDHIIAGSTLESTDGGETWTNLNKITGLFSIKFASNSSLFGVADFSLFYSGDDGSSWEFKSELPNCGDPCSLSFLKTDSTDPDTLYLGLTQGTGLYGTVLYNYLYKTTDGGISWNEITDPNIGTSFFPHSITIDPNDHNTIYLGADSVYKSTDAGANWVRTGFTLAANYKWINSVIVDPANPQKLYVCTGGQGIYRSLDGGLTWESFNTGIESGDVRSLIPISEDEGGMVISQLSAQSISAASRKNRIFADKAGKVFSYYSLDLAPSALSLSSNNLPGKMPLGYTVGTFNSTDPNSEEHFYYSLITGDGDTDNASFKITGKALKSKVVFDSSVKDSYLIRVRTTDSGGLFYENAFTISITTNTSAPLQLAPANDDILLSRLPLLDWEDTPGALSYNIQISKNNTFNSIILNSKSPVTSLQLSKALPAVTILYWRVRSYFDTKSKIAGPWSPPVSFSPPNPPGVPKPTLPKNNSKLKTLSPLLSWSHPKVPTGIIFQKYQLQLSTNPAFSPMIKYLNLLGINSSVYTPYPALTPLTKYYWRVRSFNTNEQPSEWSAVYLFTTP